MSVLLGYLGRERLTVTQLEQLYEQGKARPGFVHEVIATLGQLDPEKAHRALWLLRKVSAESCLDAAAVSRVIECSDVSEHWLFRLTLCQLLAETTCPPEAAEDAFSVLRKCFDDRRVIIRAWALTALVRLPRDRAREGEIRERVRAAERDPAKSMQARLRHLTRRA